MERTVNYNDIVEIIRSNVEFVNDIVDVIKSSVGRSKLLNQTSINILMSNMNMISVLINQIDDFYRKTNFANVDKFLVFLKTSTEKLSSISKLTEQVNCDAIVKYMQNLSEFFSQVIKIQIPNIKNLYKDIKTNIEIIDIIANITEKLAHISNLSKQTGYKDIINPIQELSKIINRMTEIPRIKFKDIIGIMHIMGTMRLINLIAIDLLLHMPLYSRSLKSIKMVNEMIEVVIHAMDIIKNFLHISSELYFASMKSTTIMNPSRFIKTTKDTITKLVLVTHMLLASLPKMLPSINVVKFKILKMRLDKWIFISGYINKLLTELKPLCETIIMLSSRLNESIIQTGLKNISVLLNGINELLLSTKLSIKTIFVALKIRLILKQFIKLIKPIKMMANASSYISGALKFTSKFELFLVDLDTVLNRIGRLNTRGANNIEVILRIIKSLTTIAIQLIFLAVLSPAAIVAIIPVMLFVLALNLFVKYVKLIFSGLNPRAFRRISKGLWKIAAIFASLAIIAASIVILAVMCVPAVLALEIVGIFLGGLSILFGILYIALSLTNQIASWTFVLNLLKISLILFILTVIAAAVVMLGVVSIGALIVTPAIVLFLIDLVVITALFIAVGSIAAMLIEVVGVAIAGLWSILMLVGIMLMIAAALWLLGKIVIDVDKVLENVKIVLSTASAIIENIFNNDTEDQTKKSGDKTFAGTIVNMLGGAVKGILSIINLIVGIPYLLMIFISITLILFIATALRILQVLDLNPGKISENVGIVLDTAKLIIDSIFSREQEDKTKTGGGDSTLGSWIDDRLGDRIRGIISVINIIIGVVYLFMIFMAVAMILFIVTALRILQTIDLKPDIISKNVGTVFETADQVIMSIFNSGKEDKKQPEEKDKPWYASLFDWVCDFGKSFLGGLGRVAGLIVSIPYLVLILTSVGLIWSIVSILNQIATFNLSSTTISTKVGDIIKVANSVIDAIFNNDIKVTKINPRDRAKLRTVLNTIKDFTDQVQKLPKDIQGTVEIIKNLKLMQSVNHNALYILSYINKQTYDYDKISRSLDLLERFNEVTKDFVDVNNDDVRRSKELTDNYIKYIDKINGIDLENLKTTERLFSSMAKFSESINGDFDKLAESLNDRIAPLLEELKNLMSQMPSHINKASSDQQKTAIDLANNNVTQNTYKRAGMSTKEQQETTHKNEKLTQSQYDSLNNIEKIVKILEGNDVNGGVKISRSR